MHPDRKETLVAAAFALGACALWSGNFVVARGVHGWMMPVGFAFWRWTVAFFCVLPLAWPHVRTGIACFKRNPALYVAMGVVGAGVFNTLMYEAARHTSANNLALLAATSPIWTLFLAGVFKPDELSRYRIAGMGIAFLGALAVITKGDYGAIAAMRFNFGDALAFAASWLWAGYSLLLRFTDKRMHPFFLMLLIVTFGLATIAPLYAVETAVRGRTPFTLDALYAYLYVGVGASVVAWHLFNRAVFMIGAVRTSLIYYSLPLFGAVLSAVFLDEGFHAYHLAGFLLITAGVVTSNLPFKRR
jgi:drug/metabolite transporter (DMT)-like permease